MSCKQVSSCVEQHRDSSSAGPLFCFLFPTPLLSFGLPLLGFSAERQQSVRMQSHSQPTTAKNYLVPGANYLEPGADYREP